MANQLATDDLKKLLQSIGNDVSEIKEMVSYHTALAVAEEAAAKTAANAAAKAAANAAANPAAAKVAAKAAAKATAANAAAKAAAKAAANANDEVQYELILIDGIFYAKIKNDSVYEYDELSEKIGEYVGKYNSSTDTINRYALEPKYEGGRRRKRKTRKGKKRSYRKRK